MKNAAQLIVVVMCFIGLTSQTRAEAFNSVLIAAAKTPQQPVMIQGPMPIEAEFFVGLLENVKVEYAGNAIFYIGKLEGYPIVVAKTGKGIENTAAATAIGIERYHPRAIINQGTSGGHDPTLAVGDIVLGERTVNTSNFKTPVRKSGDGSEPLDWIPMDIMASSGSAGEGDEAEKAERIRFYAGNEKLLEAALHVKSSYQHGDVVKGTIGSGNFWNNELDRIAWLHERFGTSAEEMESSAAAQISHAYGVPFLAIRVLSNNATNEGKYDPQTAKYCQAYVEQVVRRYILSFKE